MSYQIEDILQVVCSEVKASHANDFQKIYLLNTSVEAKLAYDVMVAFGFDVKVYHTPDKPSKLYVANPKGKPDYVQQQIASALAYARALKHIKTSLDELCAADISVGKANGFTLAFVNTQPSGKQILIQVTQEAAAALASEPEPSAAPAPAASQANAPVSAASGGAPAKISANTARKAKKIKRPKEEDDFISGPAVGRSLYPSKIVSDGSLQKETMRKRFMLRVFGNFATSGYATLMWLVFAGVLFSFFVFAKGWLCYDFVAKKSNKWYCQDPAAVSAEEARKQQKLEEQKKLGLAPVDQP